VTGLLAFSNFRYDALGEGDTMAECLFCKIRDREIPSRIAYEDADCLAFHDINPQAPLHALVVPRRHIPTLNDLTDADAALVGHLHVVAARLAREAGHGETGYRTLFNCNAGAGQTVFHIHLHVLAGRPLHWPPG
jgi:histidine triad (HIT) family protein